MNVSGVAGLVLDSDGHRCSMVATDAALRLLATRRAVSSMNTWRLHSSLLISVGLYSLVINCTGDSLARREIEILEAVREPADE